MKNVIVSWWVLEYSEFPHLKFYQYVLLDINDHWCHLNDKQICMVHKLGYGNWDELKAAFRTSPLFRFDWFIKSRTTQELARRCDTLIRLVEKENQEHDERERQARKEKKLAKVCFPPSLMDSFIGSTRDYVCTCIIYIEMCLLNFNSILFQSMTPSKRALARQTESPTNLKKRKQLSMDDYVNSVSFLDTISNHLSFCPLLPRSGQNSSNLTGSICRESGGSNFFFSSYWTCKIHHLSFC